MRIVYVEDNPANFVLVRKVLEAHGDYVVEQATSGEAGWAMIQADPPALVLLDLDLPAMPGLELARMLKADERLQGLPIVAISASVMKDERAQALEAGCMAFIEKPFDIQELRRVVAEATRASARRR
ncbi:response regulator [Paraliomyxa miuraensis]|uniref:response regulator n=1 Tax=Paraliomyxa miuraensis TaxID=376150 RepID=UPI00225B631A|nr:response regulator [Paraliomyxa miuraensis]MCX4240734.1 response regulator [Paraliomyxa miuraensis]